jgi:hypothetical protein
MTMTLFEDKDFRGRSLSVTRNIASLKDTSIGNNPSSFRMGEGDAILLIDIEIARIVCRADKISSISGIGRRRAFPALGRTRASWISSWSTALIPAMSARASSHGGAMSPSSR